MNSFEQSLNGKLKGTKGTLDEFVKAFYKNKYPYFTPEESTAPFTVDQLFKPIYATSDTEDSEQGNAMGAYFFKEKWAPEYLPELKQKIREGLVQGIQRFQKKYEHIPQNYNIGNLAIFSGMNTTVKQELADVFSKMGIEDHIQDWFVTEVVDNFSGYLINENVKAYKKAQADKAYEKEQADKKRKQSKKESTPTESAAVA